MPFGLIVCAISTKRHLIDQSRFQSLFVGCLCEVSEISHELGLYKAVGADLSGGVQKLAAIRPPRLTTKNKRWGKGRGNEAQEGAEDDKKAERGARPCKMMVFFQMVLAMTGF